MFAISDAETTGLTPWSNEILTLCTIITDDDLNEIDRINIKIKPEFLQMWSEQAEEVHGISKEEASHYPSSEDSFNEYLSFLHSHGCVDGFNFCCHALPFKSEIDLFDRNFMFAWFWQHNARADFYKQFPESKTISTILKKRSIAEQKWGLKSQKLESWANKLGVDYSLAHSAQFDTELCLKVLKYQRGYDRKTNRKLDTRLFGQAAEC